MNIYEVSRVISFISLIREKFQLIAPAAEAEAHWKMVSHLMQRWIEGRSVTLSELIQISELPYATAHRRISELVDQGAFERQTKTDGTKRFDIAPSDSLQRDFFDYAQAVKEELAKISTGNDFGSGKDYYFGGDHQAQALTDKQSRLIRGISGVENAQFLFHEDNYFKSIRHLWSDFRQRIGSFNNFNLLNLDQLHAELVTNAKREISSYDIVAINAPWVAEFAARGAIQNLQPLVNANQALALSFNSAVWDLGTWNGKQFGVPGYATAQILATRKDLFERREFKAPATFDDVLRYGRALHDPKAGQYGVVWNGRTGIDVAHTFMFILGCCGAPIPDMAQVRGNFERQDLNGKKIRALIGSYAAVEALEFMKELIEISPPNVLAMSWQDSLDLFLRGKAAMTYIWSIHAARFEMDINSAVKRRVAYLPPATGKRGRSMTPLGGFVLSVPTNLPAERVDAAIRTIEWMSSSVTMQAKSGFPLSPFFSLNSDPGSTANFPIYNLVKSLAQKRLLNIWQRPATPKYVRIETVLGEEVHQILSGHKTINAGLKSAHSRISTIDGE